MGRSFAFAAGLAGAVLLGSLCWAAPSAAQSNPAALDHLQRELDSLRKRLSETEERARQDAQRIKILEQEIDRLKVREEASAAEAPPASAPSVSGLLNVFNPRITVFGNALLRVDDQKVFIDHHGERERVDDQFTLRETEIDFRAAVDPYADGVLVAAFESEVAGEFETDIEEGYVNVKNLPFLEAPPLALQLKAGRFRTEFGLFNIHTHDLPQATRPLVVQDYLGGHGFIADGASARILLPRLLDAESAWELTGQIVQGGGVRVAPGGTHGAAYLGNLRWTRTFGDHHFGNVAFIFFSGHAGEGDPHDARLYSIDALYKWKPLRQGQWKSFLFGGQFFFAERQVDSDLAQKAGKPTLSPFGYFAFLQYQFNRQLFLGLRWDWHEDVDDDTLTRRAIHPYVSYYLSEFLRLRAGWEHRWSDDPEEDGLDTALAELNFVIGSHPPEPFWVNR